MNIVSLLDFYSGILNEKQAEIFDFCYNEDLSLAEIAELVGMSRQAVHHHLKLAGKKMELLEQNLQLRKKYQNIKHELTALRAVCAQDVKMDIGTKKNIEQCIVNIETNL